MGPAHLHGEWTPHGLPYPTRNHPAHLWWPSMVIYLPPAARGWWTTAARGSTRQRHMLRLDDGCTRHPAWLRSQSGPSLGASGSDLRGATQHAGTGVTTTPAIKGPTARLVTALLDGWLVSCRAVLGACHYVQGNHVVLLRPLAPTTSPMPRSPFLRIGRRARALRSRPSAQAAPARRSPF